MRIDSINTDLRVILAAKMAGDWPAVNEASLARAYQHTKNGQFGIVTSYRAGRSPHENRATFTQLKALLNSKGLGGIMLIGHWQECQDPTIPYQDCPDELKQDVTEPAFFIPNISLDMIKDIGSMYKQDAIIYCGPETSGIVSLVFNDGTTKPLGSFHPNQIARAYSELHGKPGRTFVFEYIAQDYIETLVEMSMKP